MVSEEIRERVKWQTGHVERSQREIEWVEEGEMERSEAAKGQEGEDSKCKGGTWGEKNSMFPSFPAPTPQTTGSSRTLNALRPSPSV